jgi:hypothetical protein
MLADWAERKEKTCKTVRPEKKTSDRRVDIAFDTPSSPFDTPSPRPPALRTLGGTRGTRAAVAPQKSQPPAECVERSSRGSPARDAHQPPEIL